MKRPYSITWYGTPVDNGEHATFSSAVARIREGIAAGCDRRGYHLQNNELTDEDDNGLTEEESDALHAACWAPVRFDRSEPVPAPVCELKNHVSALRFRAMSVWG